MPGEAATPVELHLTLEARPGQVAGSQGVGKHATQLGRHGHQEGLVLLAVAALLGLLHHQHAEHAALVDDGHAKETGVALLAGGLEVAKLRVRLGVLEVEWFLAPGHQAHQALTDGQGHLPHRLTAQADGLHQHQAVDLLVEQVEGADVGLHRLANAPHHGGERRVQAAGPVDFLDDAAQDLEHVERVSLLSLDVVDGSCRREQPWRVAAATAVRLAPRRVVQHGLSSSSPTSAPSTAPRA